MSNESKNIYQTLAKTKIVGVLMILIGIAFFFMPVAFLVQNLPPSSAVPIASVIFYIIADAAEIAAAIVFWIFGAKILAAKSS